MENIWISSLANRAKQICSQIDLEKDASWNGYPRYIVNSIITRTMKQTRIREREDDTDAIKIFVKLKYSGVKADQLIKGCFKKLYKCFKKDIKVKFILQYTTTKMSFFTNTKDKTPFLSQSTLVYKFSCPGCNESYIEKTDRTILDRVKEHGSCSKADKSAIFDHITNCSNYQHILGIFNIDKCDVNYNNFNTNQIKDNIVILDKADNWNVLLFKEALMIKKLGPSLNTGLKSSKDLQLF